MRASLEAGCHYLDLGGLYGITGRQLELSGEFERAGLLAILGIGSAPGKTNLMAKAACDRLGGSLDFAHVIAAGRDMSPPEGLRIPYALRTLIDELTLPPVVLREGKPVELEPLSDGGEVDFGDPIGAGETIHTLHSELRTFGSSFGCREASFRLSLPPALLAELRELIADLDTPGRERRRWRVVIRIDARSRGGPAVAGDGVGAHRRGRLRRPRRARPRRHPPDRGQRHGRGDHLDRRAGRRGRAPACTRDRSRPVGRCRPRPASTRH